MPNFASEEATIRSQPRSNSNPPATAVAWAAPMTGTVTRPSISFMKPVSRAGSLGPDAPPPAAKARRSMPAQKARSPVPVSTMARISGSSSAWATAAPIPPRMSGVSALRASGRFSLATRTLP